MHRPGWAEGVLTRPRVGHRNQYRIRTARRLRQPVRAHCRVADLLELEIFNSLAANSCGGLTRL